MSEATQATLDVEGMNCASCVAHVTKAALRVPGVTEVRVNLAAGKALVEFDPASARIQTVADAITDSGYTAKVQSSFAQANHHDHHAHASNAWQRRAIVGLIMWFPLELTHWALRLAGHPHEACDIHDWMIWASIATSTIALVYVGGEFYSSALKALRHRTSNMDTLIAMGATVAWLYSLIATVGHWLGLWPAPVAVYFMESTGLLALISLGHWLEARARDAAGHAIRELMTLAPSTALRLDESGSPKEIPAADVKIGDRILVRPGDRIPIDGIVESGLSAVDESMISGEPLPVSRGPGEEVVAGTLSTDGRLTLKATRVGSETSLAQIVRLVESAQSGKPPVQKLADQISAIFVPTVLCIALITGIGWYAWGMSHHWTSGQTWAALANAVCSVLIIACPCALGLALPAATMVGMGMGARRGILIRDIDVLQKAERINTVVLDKTGTITRGKPVVDFIHFTDGLDQRRLLGLAASAEQFSSHPLAKAIVSRAQADGALIEQPGDFLSEAGLGVTAQIGGRTLLVGSEELLKKFGWIGDASSSQPLGTVVHIGQKESSTVTRLGWIAFTDPVKEESISAIADLHAMNLKTVLLTGDAPAPARAVAALVGITDVRAGVKPAQKAQAIKELQNNGAAAVAMVGDGINDAPALASADLGIAIGSGADVAKETGGIVLVGESLRGVGAAIRLSRATMRVIRQNLFLAFIYNVIAIPLAALGLLNPLISAAAMALSDVSVIGNALRLRRTGLD